MMKSSSEKSQSNQDCWANGEDSPVITIEYLRARLLSERSISKAAKERADELSKRVKELEEQLKTVSLQRKRAEKATLDVLSYLESHGVSDISELYESQSETDHEDSLCESNTGKSNYGSLEPKGNGKESSGSDHESAPSSTGSLSWKGRKKTAQLLEKKYFDSPTRRQTSSLLVDFTPRRRHGKSCRQVKRREVRSVVEEPVHDSLVSDVPVNNTLNGADHHGKSVDTRSDKAKQSPDRRGERGFRRNEVALLSQDQTQAGDANSSNRGHERGGGMERALKHQAQLIGLHQAQEKAQRDWEEKYGDNQLSTQDSCEPGSHSDVTEDRDDNKATIPNPGEIAAHHGTLLKEEPETNSGTKESPLSQFDGFKLSADANTGRTKNHKLSQPADTGRTKNDNLSPDFAFPTVNEYETLKHGDGQSTHAETEKITLSGGVKLNGNHSIVPREASQRPEGILSALLEAKLILKQQMTTSSVASESAQREISVTSNYAKNDVDWLHIPVTCPGLFRVPTDFSSESPSHSRSLVVDTSRRLSESRDYGRTSYLNGYHNMASPMSSRFSTASGDAFSDNPVYVTGFGNSPRPRLDYQSYSDVASSSRSGFPPYTNSPDFLSSPNQILSTQLPTSEAGVPLSWNPMFYSRDVRPNTYR